MADSNIFRRMKIVQVVGPVLSQPLQCTIRTLIHENHNLMFVIWVLIDAFNAILQVIQVVPGGDDNAERVVPVFGLRIFCDVVDHRRQIDLIKYDISYLKVMNMETIIS